MKPIYIRPSVQPLTVPLSVLLPELCEWYLLTPDSQDRRARLAKLQDRYDRIRLEFNRIQGTEYRSRSSAVLRCWIRSRPSEYKGLPYLDEVLILAVAFGSDPSDVLNRYSVWVLDAFHSATQTLEGINND